LQEIANQVYYTIQPGEALSDYVQFFWVLEGEASRQQPFVHRALAAHCAELIFYYKGSFVQYRRNEEPTTTFTSGLFAQSRQFSVFETTDNYSLFGVYLYPYTMPLLSGHSGEALSDQVVDCTTLFGKEGNMLEEKIMLAIDNAARVRIVSDFLTRQLSKRKNKYPVITSCIRNVVQGNTFSSVQSLINFCHLSRRQFERKLKEQAGFNPKDFLRLARFTAALRSPAKITSLAKLAIDCGYYDQAHFIHDFKRFSGWTPARFFKLEADPETYRAFAEPAGKKAAILQF
jgi:AraC-like DNA-binding protein